jgi:hypothetical protein
VLVWVSQLGHVHAVKLDDALRGVPPVTSLPLDMLELQAGERPHLVLAPNNAGAAELWLADDKEGAVRVWRTALAKALDPNADWTWETLLEHEDVGHLRGIAVGIGSRARENLASQWFVVSSEKATAAYSRAAKNAGSEAVLPREPVAPPVLTSVGYLTQDRAGLWLRGFPPWSFHEGNPERKVLVPARPQSASMTRAGFYDRTLAVLGRQVFFAHAGMVCGARLVSRRHAATAEKT